MNNTIRVILVEPDRLARIAEIPVGLKSYQQIVGGDIETCYPFAEEVCIVCNDEGKINGLPLNRMVYGDDGEPVDIIAGTFFVCDCSGEDFGSLSHLQVSKYLELFRLPEQFLRSEFGIIALPYVPENN